MVGRNKKSANKAKAMTIAVNNPMPEFNSKPEVDRIKKPATKTMDVISSARPTVQKA